MTRLFILIIALPLFFSACSDEGNDITSDRTVLLTDKEWKLTSSRIDPPLNILGNDISDVYALLPACEKDGYVHYARNKTGFYDEGASKCNPADEQRSHFNWRFIKQETHIVQHGDTIQITITPVEFTAMLSVDASEYGGTAGQKISLINTYTH